MNTPPAPPTTTATPATAVSTTTTVMQSILGPLQLCARDGALCAVRFSHGIVPDAAHSTPKPEATDTPDAAVLRETQTQLHEYFARSRQTFDLPLAPDGTAFQQRVWDELQRIPLGQTLSYRQLAQRLGDVNATRAVGRANATNPIPIIVPCHRVIGSNGSLTGYAGGLDRKLRLLELEDALPAVLFP